VLLTIAALALAGAVQVRVGLYSPWAIALLACTVAFAFAAPAGRKSPQVSETGNVIRYAVFGVAAAVFLLIGVRALRSIPSPHIDVFVFQRDACEALLRGINPYTITYPNIYQGEGSFVYDPALLSGDRLLFGFPYLPLTLWFDLIGHAALGDYRLVNLLAVLSAATFVLMLARSMRSLLAAVLLLFAPPVHFILVSGWTEPLTVMLLAATIFVASRYPSALPYTLGLLLASKQYMALALLLVPLLADWRDWRFYLRVIATAAIVTLPLGLWDFRAFWDSAVVLQFRQPFRDDALSFAAMFVRAGFGRIPTIVPLILAVAVALLCLKKLKQSPHSFALAFTLTFLTFFAFNKQAFANYYFLVIASLCCALATAPRSGTPRRAATAPHS
jgi:hypothetical protein